MAASQGRKGFSLVEILIAIVLVGLSITALVTASNSFTMANGAGADLSTAEFLAEQIRELTIQLPVSDPAAVNWTNFGPETGETLDTYNDVDDFDGATFSPPISADKATLGNFPEYTQRVTVQKLNPSDFDAVVDDIIDSPFVRVQVDVLRNGDLLCSTTWIRARY
jgi:prepilin-type N-terminal cleavage/methylation domain-containing protein